MTDEQYIELVIEKIHARSLAGELKWKTRAHKATADVTEETSATFKVKRTGPDTGVWEDFSVYNQALEHVVILVSKHSVMAHLGLETRPATAARLDEVFELAYLAPIRALIQQELSKLERL